MLLLISSAVLYALSFVVSEYLWWVTFLFPVPLFFYSKQYKLSFMHGYIWGFIAYGLQISSICVALYNMSIGPFWIRVLPGILLLFYMPLFSAFSFFISQKIFSNTLLVIVFGLFLSIFLIDNYALLMCARLEGYMLISPLIPLCQVPQLLWLLPYVGIWIMTILWISVPIFLFLAIQEKKYIPLLFLSLLPFISGFLINQKQHVPDWIDVIVHVPKLFGPTNNQRALILRVQKIIRQVIVKHPQVEVIIFPEGALYCKDLACKQSLTSEWSKKKVGKKVNVIIGTFHEEGDRLYNSLQWFYDGKLMGMHHKQHVLPITEQLPWWLSCEWYKDAYFSCISEITPAIGSKKLFTINNSLCCVPFICSEFFFKKGQISETKNISILLVCNDSWFDFPECMPYMQTLMRLGAQFSAIKSQKSIVYVAFSSAYYVDQSAKLTSIFRFDR